MSKCDDDVVFQDAQEIKCKFVKNTLCLDGEDNQEKINILGLEISYADTAFQMMVGGEQSFDELFKLIKDEINTKLDDAIKLVLGE